jgi:hypothetical protein
MSTERGLFIILGDVVCQTPWHCTPSPNGWQRHCLHINLKISVQFDYIFYNTSELSFQLAQRTMSRTAITHRTLAILLFFACHI